MSVELNDQELSRYSRQLLLPQFDVAGQIALKSARAIVVGLGGLGGFFIPYVADPLASCFVFGSSWCG